MDDGKRHGLGVSEFEVLDRLAESGRSDFRSQELAEAVHLSQSALSRLVDRLARHGLVERCGCDVDRRGIYVWNGNFYALPWSEYLGLEPDGVVRIGLLHYNTSAEIARLMAALRELES